MIPIKNELLRTICTRTKDFYIITSNLLSFISEAVKKALSGEIKLEILATVSRVWV